MGVSGIMDKLEQIVMGVSRRIVFENNLAYNATEQEKIIHTGNLVMEAFSKLLKLI